MEFIEKYQEIRRHVLSIAEQHSFDEEVRQELVEFDKLLSEKLQTLNYEKEKYKVLFEKSGDCILVLSHEGKILEVNSTACKKYGIPHDEFIDISVLEIDASQNREDIMEKIDDLMRIGNTRFEAVHKNRKGEFFNVDVVAQKIVWNDKPAVLDICRDITRQKELEKALNGSEVKLKKIINQITDGLIVFESDGNIVIWNSGAEQITGIKKQHAEGKKFYEIQYDLLHGKHKDKEFIRERFNEVVTKSNPEVFDTLVENEIFVAGKGVRTIQANVFHIDLDNGNQLFGSLLRDITRQKEAETSLKELLATKDKIYSIIAHDLRTPFNSIIGFTELLLNNYDKYEKDRVLKILEFINLSARPMLDVLTNMLNWVTTQTGHMAFHPQPQPLKMLIKEVVEMMKSSAEIKNIKINQFLEDDFIVLVDVNMLQSVLQNLLANAIKFSHSAGKVDIYARKNKNFAEIEISDEGIGIEEKKKNSLFRIDIQESTRGTSGEKGSGLGLILCKEFIEKHGGEIRAESQPGEGSSFVFTIPLVVKEQKTRGDITPS